MESPKLINISTAPGSVTPIELTTATNAAPSPVIGFEATMSAAMELESTLKSTNNITVTSLFTSGQRRQPANGSTPIDDIDITSSSNGHQHHHLDDDDDDESSRLDQTKTNTDDCIDNDLLEDEYDDDDRHSVDTEGHCSYGSVDTSKDDDLDDDLDHHHHHHHHHHHTVDKYQNSLDRNGLSGGGGGGGGEGRPDSGGDGDYYDGSNDENSSYRHQHQQQQQQQQQQLGGSDLLHRHQRREINDDDDTTRIHQCHLCPFTSPSKFHFNSHINTHYDHKCSLCDYRSRTEGRLKRHMKDFHSDLAPEVLMTIDKSGKTSTKDGGQGNKIKTYKCKQCNYMATVKSEFWAHTKSHIKAEKLLACPRCPFVTEYKHHLEYHLRNHFGSKPFKCPKCSYSCVNKSMLNSHMKSHSNVYQYRCADCTYATKYCHSLKLHLRKYAHVPATVLNLDGTPNPMPIIDVYGTRRGPRPKKNQTNMYISDDLPINGAPSGGAPQLASYFYSSSNGSGSIPNGFHTSPQLPTSNGTNNNNNSTDENGLENGNKDMTVVIPIGSFKCNLCEYATDNNDLFNKHMLRHAAENQDLCNLYGINSETLLQDPNQQQVNVATMAAMAAALGIGTGSGGFLRQTPQQSPQQRLPIVHLSRESGGHNGSEMHSPGGIIKNGGTKLEDQKVSQVPLEHLRAFTEHINLQPFVMSRDFATVPLFPTTDLNGFQEEQHHHSRNGFSTNKLPSQQQQQQQQQQETSKSNSMNGAKSLEAKNGGLGPLDLSNTKPTIMHSPRQNGPYYNVHQLKHHHHSPFQHFGLTQQCGPQINLATFQQLSGSSNGQLKEENNVTDDCIERTSPVNGQRNRRKGKAFKLDRICLKLQKDKDGFEDDSGDEQKSLKMSKDDEDDQESESIPINSPRSEQMVSPSNHQQRKSKSPDYQPIKNVDKDQPEVDDVPVAMAVAVTTLTSKEENGDWKEAYKCQYCDMAFKDCIMYTVHMGYHGFKDPFKCNMCGQQTNDKVAFFLHIARTAHL